MCATMAALGPFSKSSKSCKSPGATFHFNNRNNGLRGLRSLRLMAKIIRGFGASCRQSVSVIEKLPLSHLLLDFLGAKLTEAIYKRDGGSASADMNARDPFLWQRDGTDAAGRLGRDDLGALAFFPGMNQPAARKVAWLAGFLDEFELAFEVVPLGGHAEALEAAPHLPLRASHSNPTPDPYAARFGPADRSGRRGWSVHRPIPQLAVTRNCNP